MTASARHPWLETLRRDPSAQVRALIDGVAAVTPYERAEPGDAAAMLLGGLPDDDPVRADFDRGCLAVLDDLRHELRTAATEDFPFVALAVQRLLLVVRRLRPAATVADLHRRYVHWHDALESCVIDHGLDPRREYWRLLALTQDHAPDHSPRRLLPLWLDICAQAGPYGRLDHTYLDVGLLGLRKLPIGGEIAANEEAVCHGLALWAAHQLPDRKTFESRWWEIEAAYPRGPDYWPPLVARVLATSKDKREARDFPASRWWREAVETDALPFVPLTLEADAEQEDGPPPARQREDILEHITQPVALLEPRIHALMAAHRRYADASGDTYYLVRTASNVGQRLLEKSPGGERTARGELAVFLARTALDYLPTHPYAWSLWRDGLDYAGHALAAEAVGWEALRRFPENRFFGTQLAKLLCGHGRFDDARRVLERNRQAFPDHAHSHAQLAGILTHFGQFEQAAAVLEAAIALCPDDTELPRQLGQAKARKPLTKRFRITPVDDNGGQDSLPLPFPAAQAQRALVWWQAATNDDERNQALAAVRQALARDPGLAYHRYVAALTGAATENSGDGVFAVAFARAVARRDWQGLETLAHRGGSHAALAQVALAQVALAVAQGRPPPETDLPDAPSTGRVKVVIRGATVHGAPPQALLRLMADFAASDLSLSPVQSQQSA